MKKILLLAVTTLLLSACSETPEMAEQTYTGKFFYGPEVEAIKLCNSTTEYWITLDAYGDKMLDYYRKNFKEPYQGMYMEVRGVLEGRAVEGFAEEYENVLRVTEQIKEYTFKIPETCK